MIEVDWRAHTEIEREACTLLASFEKRYGTIKTTAMPLAEITENYLGLTCELMDLGHEEILGQIDIIEKTITINESLDSYDDCSGHCFPASLSTAFCMRANQPKSENTSLFLYSGANHRNGHTMNTNSAYRMNKGNVAMIR